MAITRKNQKFIDEYFIDFNASAAAVRAGYSEVSARSIASELLTKPDIKEEVERRMADSRISTDEIIKRLEAMVTGEAPTKRVVGSNERVEYDTIGAAEKLGKVYALFVDKSITEIDNLDIIDDEVE